MLKGKLTYIMAAFAILGGISGFLMNAIQTEVAIGMIWSGLAVFGIRRAIANQ